MAAGLIKFIDIVIFVPLLMGLFAMHRFSSYKNDAELRKILLTGYSLYGAVFVIFYYASNLLGIDILRMSTIWKYFCVIATILIFVIEIKNIIHRIKNINKLPKIDIFLILFITGLFILFSAVLYHRPYQGLAVNIMTWKLSEPDPIYGLYFIIGFITGFSGARPLYYLFSAVLTVIYFLFYKEVGLFFFKSDDSEETNRKAAVFTLIAALIMIFPVFDSSLDIFGVFICPWKSETLLNLIFAPAVFIAGLKIIAAFSSESLKKEKIYAILFLLLTCIDALLSSKAALIYFITVLLCSIILSFIKKKVFSSENNISGKEVS